MTKYLELNTEEVQRFANKLESMHKSGFPTAVRQTLNRAAFDVKGGRKSDKTLEETTDQVFTKRSKNFFKIISKVVTADGFKIKAMESQIGLHDQKLKGSNNFATRNLVKQAKGGNIDGRNFVPLDTARSGKSNKKSVRKKFRLSNINDIIDAGDVSGRNPAEKFIKSAIHAGKGGFVLGTFGDGSGNRFLYHINSIKRRGRETYINSTPIYAYEKDRSFDVEQTKFMRKAAVKSGRKMQKFFNKEAQKQVKRLMNK